MLRGALPPLSSLRAFEAYARAGSMTAAAAQLGVTHKAVSRQVKALERQLGCDLVHGPKHVLRLTQAGRELAASDLVARALPDGTGGEEELVVSCLDTFAMKWLIPRLPRFLEAAPGVRVRFVESSAPADFSGGDVHAAVRILGSERPAGMRVTTFMAHHHGPVLSPALLSEVGADRTRLLSLPRLYSETFRPAWAQWAAAAGVTLPASALGREFEHNSYMLEACVAGLGVAVTPWAFAADDVVRGRLLAPIGFVTRAERFAYLRPKLGRKPAAERFGEWLQEEGQRATTPDGGSGQPAATFAECRSRRP